MSSDQGVSVERIEDGRIARLTLDAGKGNVLSTRVVSALRDAFVTLGAETRVRAVLLTHAGNDFSFGASVPEHAPGEVEKMLPTFHGLFRAIAAASLPVVAAVRGRCLGGGFEVAIVATHLVVAEDAMLGVPEVTLGVFPPIAAALLPFRVPQPVVDRLVTLGETLTGMQATKLGVADEAALAEQVEARALEAAKRWTKLSGVAVRHATRAARAAWNEALGARLEGLEAQYLRELMETRDAREGIAAFMERRKPVWEDR